MVTRAVFQSRQESETVHETSLSLSIALNRVLLTTEAQAAARVLDRLMAMIKLQDTRINSILNISDSFPNNRQKLNTYNQT